MPRKFFRSAWLVGPALAVLFFWLVLAPAVWAGQGFLVSDSAKECIAVAANPGIGLGGYYFAEACPPGYTIKDLPEPEVPWFEKLLDALDSWFGLKNIIIFVPSAGQIALITSVVLVLRRLLQVLQIPVIDRLTHGVGVLVLSAIISFLTVVQPMLEGGLSVYEVLAAVGALIASVGGSAGLWELLKRLVGYKAS